MKILQFKYGGEYHFNVTYETITDKHKLQTNDEPTGGLFSAIADATTAAVQFYRLFHVISSFKQITFSYPGDGIDYFVFELEIKTKDNYSVAHSLKTEKLPLITDDDIKNDLIEQKNNLTEKIIKLREEIEAYVSGARAQQEFDFDEQEKNGDELFEE
jgi:hypothetical protein